MYRGRFAPSPTGPLHFGSLVSALASWLDARAAGGEWLLRIEDIDTPRVVPGAADDILRTLEAFGLHWDGEAVWQSRRLARYETVLERLWAQGLAYACACTRRQLAVVAARGPGGTPIYPGTCRELGLPRGPGRALRLRVPDAVIAFDDAVQGRVAQNLARELGDYVILRADGLFAYQLVVVIDDAGQGVTHVVRGADLLDSTPRQIHLLHLLGEPVPTYAHLPLAVDAHGDKLSKKTRAPALERSRPAPALVEALHFLGQRPAAGLEAEAPQTVLAWARVHWDLQRVPKAPSVRWTTPLAVAAPG